MESQRQPRLVPFCSIYEDGRKTSRKKIKEELARGQFYPGQGHCSAEFDRSDKHCSVLFCGEYTNYTCLKFSFYRPS